jgi:hypothetical protein
MERSARVDAAAIGARRNAGMTVVDLNHGSGYVPDRDGIPEADSLSERVNACIDRALVAARNAERHRTHIGASMLADPCARRVAYAWRGDPGAPLEGRALRIFETGHAIERLLTSWLERAGFDLRTTDPATGEQYAFADGPIEGHADGIIVNGPNVGFGYPVLWECKGLNDRSWQDTVKNGVRVSKPIYYGQCCLYMAYFDIRACLFTAVNKNDQSIYHELIPLDLAEAQRLVDRAVGIVRGSLPPRISLAPTRICAFCQFNAQCWEEETPRHA